MDTEDEKIEYSFTGDVTSLQKAVTEAVSLLGKFEKAVKTSASKGDYQFKGNLAKDFKQQFSSMYKDLSRVKTELQSLGKSKVGIPIASDKALTGAVEGITNALTTLNTKTNLTGRTIRQMTRELSKSSATLMLSSKALDAITIREAVLATANRNMGTTSKEMALSMGATFEQLKQRSINMVNNFKGVSTELAVISTNGTPAFKRLSAAILLANGHTNQLTRAESQLLIQTAALESINRRTANTARDMVSTMGAKEFTAMVQPIFMVAEGFKRMSSALTSTASSASTDLPDMANQLALVAANTKQTTTTAGQAHVSFNKFAIALRLLSSICKGVSTVIPKVSAAITILQGVLQAIQPILNGISRVIRILLKLVKGVLSTIGRVVSKLGTLVSRFKLLSSNVSTATTALKRFSKVAIGTLLLRSLSSAIKSSLDYTETLNLFRVAMGESIDEGTNFINKMQEIYGLDPHTLMKSAGMFNELASAIGAPADAAKNMSLSLTKASVDISSLFNVPVEKVAADLASGMQGMSRTVRKYGMDIRMTTIEQTALSLGLQLQAETTTEANRQGLRYITMMRQAFDATGDFARTITSPANQLRILKEQLQQAGRAIGSFFYEPLRLVLPYINGFVMALRVLIETLAAFAGYKADEFDVSDTFDRDETAIGGVGDAAEDTAKAMKKLMAPFDELNVLSEQANMGGGGGGILSDELMNPAIVAAIDDMKIKFDDIKLKANEVRDAILKFFGFDYVSAINIDTGAFEKKLNVIKGGFADNLIKAIKGDDPEGVSNAVAEVTQRLVAAGNNLVLSFQTMVSWENLGSGIKLGLAGITSAINTIFDPGHGIDFGKIGASIGTLVNTLSATLLTWFQSINFGNIALAVTDGLRGMVEKVDWINIGATIAAWFNSTIDYWGTMIATAPWGEVATSITTSLNKLITDLDWTGIGNLIGNLFKGVVKFVGTFVATMNWGDLYNGIMTAIKALGWEKIGVQLATAFNDTLKTINWTKVAETLSNLVEWVIDQLVDFFLTADWKAIGKAFSDCILGIDWWGIINSLWELLKSLVVGLLNGLTSFIRNFVVDVFSGGSDDKTSSSGSGRNGTNNVPKPPAVAPPKIKMAKGGIVTGPTNATIGEGKYNEAVIPLGSSPQLKELVNQIATAVHADPNRGGDTSTDNIIVQVQIGGKDYDAFTYKAARRGEKLVGAQPITIGG